MLEIFYYENNEVKTASSTHIAHLKNKKIWIDATNITENEVKLLERNFSLHPLTSEDLIHNRVRVKIEEFPEYLFCVLHGINKNKRGTTTEMDFLLGKNFLITCHKTQRESHSNLKNNKHILSNLFKLGPSYMFHYLLDVEIDDYLPEIDKIDDEIEMLEEKAMYDPSQETLSEILQVKKDLIKVRKVVLSQREVISSLSRENFRKQISKDLVPYFRDVYDHAIRVVESIENSRESIGNAFEVYMSAMSNNMNTVMKTLSIIATIALPLSVISSIYGTNFKYIPGLDSDLGFYTMLFFMLLIIASMLYMFRKRRWF